MGTQAWNQPQRQVTNIQLDPESQAFQDEIDVLVRKYAKGDDGEYWRRWKQLHGWAYNKTNDPKKKKRLKQRLLRERGTKCQGECHRELGPTELQMHRVDKSYANDAARDFGYFDSNVQLLCIICHRREEGLDLDVGT
jgi:hypothetical protein